MSRRPEFNPAMERLLAFAALPSGSGQALDAGCGNGRVAARLAQEGWRVTAADRRAERTWTGLNKVSFREIDLFKLDFVNPFDLVCLFGVLHYAGTAQRTRDLVGRACGWAAPSSRLVMSWITDDHPHPDPSAHLPARALVRDALEANGFRIKDWFETEIEHAHGGLPLHRHRLVYLAARAPS